MLEALALRDGFALRSGLADLGRSGGTQGIELLLCVKNLALMSVTYLAGGGLKTCTDVLRAERTELLSLELGSVAAVANFLGAIMVELWVKVTVVGR